MASTFNYLAKDRDGVTVKGRETAEDQEQLVNLLWSRGYYVLKIKEARGPGRGLLPGFIRAGFPRGRKASPRELMLFCFQVAALLKAGITALQSLRVIQGRTGNPHLARALGEVTSDLENGLGLADSFGRCPQVFPPLFIYMVEAGEMAGTVEEVLEKLGSHFEKENEFREKVKSAATYPAAVLIVAVMVVLFLLVEVLPSFTSTFAGMGVPLPGITRFMIGVGENLPRLGTALLLALFLAIPGARRLFKLPGTRARLDKALLALPLYGKLLQKVLVSRFARVLGTLLDNQVGLLTSLELVESALPNRLYQQKVARVSEAVRQGQGMTAPLAEGDLFPGIMVAMISVGEESGSLPRMLLEAADFMESETNILVDRLTTLIEPLLIIGVSLVVGLIALAVLLPMFQVFQQVI